MSERRSFRVINLVAAAAALALAACTHGGTAGNQPEVAAATPAAAPASAPAPAEPPAPPPRPMTREQASTDCWMKYEKEGRGLSLEKRLPLVEKCTAEKLKAAGG